MFEIYLSNKSIKTLRKLGDKLRGRIKALLLNLKTSPLPIKEYDLKKISGAEDIYRIRLSTYRIIYKINWDKKEINVIKISKRDETTYKNL